MHKDFFAQLSGNVVEVKFLGSGNAFCPEGRLHSLVLIDNKILVDVPPTIIPQLKRENISPSDINTLLITHWHGDHIFGFPFFILERKFISDRNPKKTNLYTQGSNIKIISEAESRKLKPDYYLVLAWHFKKEILLREKMIRKMGTKFIFPLPNIEII